MLCGPASPVPSAELVGAISIQSGTLLWMLWVYQIHSLGEKNVAGAGTNCVSAPIALAKW